MTHGAIALVLHSDSPCLTNNWFYSAWLITRGLIISASTPRALSALDLRVLFKFRPFCPDPISLFLDLGLSMQLINSNAISTRFRLQCFGAWNIIIGVFGRIITGSDLLWSRRVREAGTCFVLINSTKKSFSLRSEIARQARIISRFILL